MTQPLLPTIYLLQTTLGYQLSSSATCVGTDEEEACAFQLEEADYREFLATQGGKSCCFDFNRNEWLTPQEDWPMAPEGVVSTYFETSTLAEQALNALTTWLNSL